MPSLFPISAQSYRPHPLHVDERDWAEANCYADLWIEVLHTLGREPRACLAFTVAVDFECDQWTFFKPPLGDLLRLYGIDVQELNVWDRLEQHVEAQLAGGRLAVVEVDSFWLPDTAGTSYQTAHTKTGIGMAAIDLSSETLGYFHNGGYYELRGADFRGLFRLDQPESAHLPPYVELARFDGVAVTDDQLVVETEALLARHVRRRPRRSPFEAFAASLPAELERLRQEGLGRFHRYAFATLRQAGAAFELAGVLLRWLGGRGVDGLAEPAAELASISTTAKAMQFRLARAAAGRTVDVAEAMASMDAAWRRGLGTLAARYG